MVPSGNTGEAPINGGGLGGGGPEGSTGREKNMVLRS